MTNYIEKRLKCSTETAIAIYNSFSNASRWYRPCTTGYNGGIIMGMKLILKQPVKIFISYNKK